jgi:hypothetical protein
MSYIVHAQARLYAQEYGWDWTFEVLASRIAADFIENYKNRLTGSTIFNI